MNEGCLDQDEMCIRDNMYCLRIGMVINHRYVRHASALTGLDEKLNPFVMELMEWVYTSNSRITDVMCIAFEVNWEGLVYVYNST